MRRHIAIVLSMTLFLADHSVAATPSGDRGGSLSASDEAQQAFLRRLRREIAVQRVLSQQLAAEGRMENDANRPVIPGEALLAGLEASGVSDGTLETIKLHPPRRLNSARTTPNLRRVLLSKGSCSKAVDNCFEKLGLLFERRYGRPLKLSSSRGTPGGTAGEADQRRGT